MSDKRLTIAIDGYSSCGKSTLAKALAKRLEYSYVDSGAMYRAVTWYLLQHNVDVEDADAVIAELPNIKVSFEFNEAAGKSDTLLNGEVIEQHIRSREVNNAVSQVSKVKEVRKAMVDQQRRMGQEGGIVMDGRDIGTVVFPKADLKIFMTADMDVRVQRRFDELQAKGQDMTFVEVAKNLQERDRIDTTRSESPLRKADDAIEVDNTHLTPQQQLDLAAYYVKQKLNPEE